MSSKKRPLQRIGKPAERPAARGRSARKNTDTASSGGKSPSSSRSKSGSKSTAVPHEAGQERAGAGAGLPDGCTVCGALVAEASEAVEAYANHVRPALARYAQLTFQELNELFASCKPFEHAVRCTRSKLRSHLASTGHSVEAVNG